MPALFERTQAGKREDLADYITLVDAKDTPVTSMIPKGNKPGNTLLSFQVDNMPSPSVAGSVDGVDVSAYENLNTGRAKLNNYVQVFQRAIRVSPLSVDVSIVAGLRDELSGMVAKGIKVLKRDMEATICGDADMQADAIVSSVAVPYLTRALGSWINNTAQGVLPVPDAYLTPAASINTTATGSFTEVDAQGVLTSIYNQTGQMKTFDTVVGPTLKRAFSNLLYTATASGTNAYASIRTLSRDAFSDTISSSVDLFEGDFGSLRLHPTLFNVNAFRGYVLDMDLLELRYTNLPQVTELPDAGGGPARLIKAVAGLVCKNPLGLGKFSASS
jgi:hypothetical protein